MAHRAEPSRGARSEAPPVLNIRDNTRGPPVERQPTSWGVVGSPLAGSLKFERTISLLVDGCRRFCCFTFRQAQKLRIVMEPLWVTLTMHSIRKEKDKSLDTQKWG